MEEDYDETEESDKIPWYCDTTCPHYDGLNRCCWQVTEEGLCFSVCEGDECHLGYFDCE